jgi:hypothetical protein
MDYLKGKASIKCSKSCEDRVMPELLKYVPIYNIILGIINEVYNGGEQPDLWMRLNLKPITKSGDLTKTDNYKGISLTFILAETNNKMILNRLCPVLDPLLRNQQNGF